MISRKLYALALKWLELQSANQLEKFDYLMTLSNPVKSQRRKTLEEKNIDHRDLYETDFPCCGDRHKTACIHTAEDNK